MHRGTAIATVLLGVVAACGLAPTPTGPTAQPIVVEGRDASFALSMRVGSDLIDAGAPIDVSAILTWEGADPKVTIWGSGSGPVWFTLQQIGGAINLGGAITADCGPHEFARLVPVPIPFRKSGGWSADDPNAGFYKAFFADPVLRLPAGQWKVTAIANGYLRPCEMDAPQVDINLGAEILVR